MPTAQQEFKQQVTVHFSVFLSLIQAVALMLIFGKFSTSMPALLLEEQHYSLTYQHKEESSSEAYLRLVAY